MSVEQFAVRQDCLFVAKVDIGEDRQRALREAMHYLDVYAQDGPCELWHRTRHRKWKRTGIVLGHTTAPTLQERRDDE